MEDARSVAQLRGRAVAQVVVLPLIFCLSISIFLGFDPIPQFRIVNNYGLFAVMTRHRYEIEFQGTRDGTTWVAYPFRYKPQDPRHAPGIYAPYQPRFDWNLWFASLGNVSSNPWVMSVEQRLVENDPDVLRLFAGNPFAKEPPAGVRAMLWRYWFTTRRGTWWNRELVGEYAPSVTR